MSLEYDDYLRQHISNVTLGYLFITRNMLPEELDKILPTLKSEHMMELIMAHDASKYEDEEYKIYDDYFYHGGKGTVEGEKIFNRAFNLHVHKNPHHWQYWTMIGDEGEVVPLDMPDEYILEMICDWWSFSWAAYKEAKKNDDTNAYMKLYEIFDWWSEHERKIRFSVDTQRKVLALLAKLRMIISQRNVVELLNGMFFI